MSLKLPDVARRCDVSVVVAAAALRGRGHVDNDIATRIRETAEAGGFVPPDSWARSRIKDLPSIGVLGIHHPDWHYGAGYYDEVLRGVLTASQECRLDVCIYGECEISRTDAVRDQIDGLILFKEQFRDEIFEAIRQTGIPTITVGDKVDDLPNIDVDNYSGAYAVVRHLIDLGHRRIGAIRGRLLGDWADIRFNAYCQALKQADIPFDGSLLADVEYCKQVEAYVSVGQLLALHADNPPTAIVCPNDVLAFAAVNAIQDAGFKVPSDISVTGFDDLPDAGTWWLPLTTVRQPLQAVGVRAVQVLATLINRPDDAPLETKLSAEIIIRRSTAPPR